jgi:hypothetical protein
MPISVALQSEITIDDCCTARGKIPFQLDDDLIYWQDCYYIRMRSKQSFLHRLLLIQVTFFSLGISRDIALEILLWDVSGSIAMMVLLA